MPLNLAPLHAEEQGVSVKTSAAMPVLESALPFIRLSEDETARMRAMLGTSAAVAAPLAASPRPNGSGVAGWSGILPLPFAARIEMVALDEVPEGALDPAWFDEHLGNGDQAYFASEIAPQGECRQRDWLVGRMAARRAVSTWLADVGSDEADPKIGYDDVGRPTPATAQPVFLSVSHKDGIGAAAAADRPIGIDLERLSAIRDPRYLIDTAFSTEEAGVLADVGWADTELIAIAWSAKEAAAKSMGRRLLGHETSFSITQVDQKRETIRLTHADGEVDAYYALDGDFICVVAAAS